MRELSRVQNFAPARVAPFQAEFFIVIDFQNPIAFAGRDHFPEIKIVKRGGIALEDPGVEFSKPVVEVGRGLVRVHENDQLVHDISQPRKPAKRFVVQLVSDEKAGNPHRVGLLCQRG